MNQPQQLFETNGTTEQPEEFIDLTPMVREIQREFVKMGMLDLAIVIDALFTGENRQKAIEYLEQERAKLEREQCKQ